MTKGAKNMLRTGVKHIKPTISGFTHEKADKAESMLTRLNLRSSDPLGAGGGGTGGGSSQGTTGLDVSAAFAFEMIQVRAVERYVGRAVTASAIYDLAFYKHTGDMTSFYGIKAAAMSILVSIAIEQGWHDRAEDNRPRGIIEACAITAIQDVCSPSMFIGMSARRWARVIGLPTHQDWIRKWDRRYTRLRNCLQQLDIAADEQIKRRV